MEGTPRAGGALDRTVGEPAVIRDAPDQLPERAGDSGRGRWPAHDGAGQLRPAVLPADLPVLPRARIAARYLVADDEQAAGGDWFDALPLPGGSVALAVGDVAGHGVQACVAMGQLRAILGELLTAEPDLAAVLARADAYAARTPALRAATLALAVLDPADGTLRYATCGHPVPLIVGSAGLTRFLASTGSGPLGTGSPPLVATDALRPGELILLFSDGLVDRPHRTVADGMTDVESIAADAVASRFLPSAVAPTVPDRVCHLTIELLTRTGYAGDVTTLAAQRLAGPPPELFLRLPAVPDTVTEVRHRFHDWLTVDVDPLSQPVDALELAIAEVVTNAVEHAYPLRGTGWITFRAVLHDDGQLECTMTDHGAWREPDPAATDRGFGLMVASHMVDELRVSHPPQAAGEPAGARGTIVTLAHRLRRPAVLVAAARPVASAGGAAFEIGISAGGSGVVARIRGPLDATTTERAIRQLLVASRAGTVDLTIDLREVTRLASAGVQALYQLRSLLASQNRHLRLIAADDNAVRAVLDQVHLPYKVETISDFMRIF